MSTMKRSVFLLVLSLAATSTSLASAADWLTAPSYYSHDPQTGERVTQYAQNAAVYRIERPDFQQSGFRYTRSSLQMGRSIDHLAITEEWGNPVRPYGEWRYPFRPYSVPYPYWGAPYAGLNINYGGFFPGPWIGGGATAPPGGGQIGGPGWGGGFPGGGGAFNGIPPAALTHPAVPNNPGLGFPGQGGIYPYSDEHYPLNRGSWSSPPMHHPPSSGMGGT